VAKHIFERKRIIINLPERLIFKHMVFSQPVAVSAENPVTIGVPGVPAGLAVRFESVI